MTPIIQLTAAKELSFILDVVPGKVTHQSGTRRLRNGRSFKTSELQTLEAVYTAALLPHKPARPLEGALYLCIVLNYPWRKSERKRDRERGWAYMSTRPDLDNSAKTLIDCMTAVGFWADDGQLAQLHLTKCRSDHPCIEVTIREL